jgi:DegV family protein with EDD domain
MAKIKITGDSTIDLSSELLTKYNISIVPLYITMDDKTYRDGVDVIPDDIYSYVARTGNLPKTAAPSVEDYLQFFTELKKEYDTIIHFNISAEFSSAHQNAMIAAQELEGVYPIDSRNLSTGSALLVLKASELIEQGLAVEEVVRIIKELTDKVEASFVINSLHYLHKGGRCSGVAALGANVLKLKPCILVEDGKMNVGRKYRGVYNKCLESYIKDKLEGRNDINLERIFVTHTKCDDETVELAKRLVTKYQPFAEVLETTAGCTITNHCGEGTLGILFVRK